MTYQKVVGTLNPGGHPGSYNGQDAYNDMLVVENDRNNIDIKEHVSQKRNQESGRNIGCNGLQRPANCSENWGGALNKCQKTMLFAV